MAPSRRSAELLESRRGGARVRHAVWAAPPLLRGGARLGGRMRSGIVARVQRASGAAARAWADACG